MAERDRKLTESELFHATQEAFARAQAAWGRGDLKGHAEATREFRAWAAAHRAIEAIDG